MAFQNSPYLGLRLSDAELLLRENGVSYSVTVTEPEWKKDKIEGSLRIIQVRKGTDGNVLELICCPVSDPFHPDEDSAQ